MGRRLYTTVGELRAFIREQRLATRHRNAEGELIAMDWIHDDGPLDPRHVFLDASDVMRRYG